MNNDVDPAPNGVRTDVSGVLTGRSVLVAGATGGLGSAIAADLADRGATLTLVARREAPLSALAVPGHRVALDLRDPPNCEAAVAAAVAHAGRLDVVVNAVGVVAFGPLEELSVETFYPADEATRDRLVSLASSS